MEKHCVSLELAKQLKEAGWGKETKFWWANRLGSISNKPTEQYYLLHELTVGLGEVYPAPLATEILEELPLQIKLCRYFSKDEYRCVDDDIHRNAHTQVDSNPCNALAKMWLCLKRRNSNARQTD